MLNNKIWSEIVSLVSRGLLLWLGCVKFESTINRIEKNVINLLLLTYWVNHYLRIKLFEILTCFPKQIRYAMCPGLVLLIKRKKSQREKYKQGELDLSLLTIGDDTINEDT